MTNGHYLAFSIAILAILSAFLLGCGTQAAKRTDLAREILSYAETGVSFGDAAIAKRYTFITDAYELGAISEETFIARRDRLDKAEDALQIVSRSIEILDAAIKAGQSQDILSAILVMSDAVILLHSLMVDAGVRVPIDSEWQTFIELISGFRDDANEGKDVSDGESN